MTETESVLADVESSNAYSFDWEDISEDGYSSLKRKNPENLTVKEFFLMKFYGKIFPLKQKTELLQSELKNKVTEVELCHEQIECLRQELASEQEERLNIKSKCESALEEVRIIRCQLEDAEKNFRSINVLKEDKMHLETINNDLFKANENLTKDLDTFKIELSACQEENKLLNEEKVFIENQLELREMTINQLNDRVTSLEDELNHIRQSKEDMMETFVNTRNSEKEEYENYLREEINKFKANTQMTLEKFKTSQKFIYDDTIKSLSSDKEKLERDKRAMEEQLKTTTDNFFNLKTEFENFKREKYAQISQLEKEIRVKQYDCESFKVVKEQTSSTLNDIKEENTYLLKTIENLTAEINTLKSNQQLTLEAHIEKLDGMNSDIFFRDLKRPSSNKELAPLTSAPNEKKDSDQGSEINGPYIKMIQSEKKELQEKVRMLQHAVETLLCDREDIEEMRNELMQLFDDLKEDPQIIVRMNRNNLGKVNERSAVKELKEPKGSTDTKGRMKHKEFSNLYLKKQISS